MITVDSQFIPDNDEALKHVCWVGKGIIYDTGGLSLKSKTGMPGMKMDMGGAAAVWTGFSRCRARRRALVKRDLFG